jgi:ubiquinone/menaquinone biosynthesis C-methylase UbiE
MAGERNFDKEAALWDNDPARVKIAHDIARAIKETVPLRPDMDVLDFGCGTGLLTLQLQPLVRSVTGIDSSQGMLDVLSAKIQAQGHKNVNVCLADLSRGDVLHGRYDLVVSSMTFHHLRDISAVLGQFAGVIRESGFLAVADLDCDNGKFHDSNEGVFHFGFDRYIMMKHFEAAGFISIRNRTAAMIEKPTPTGEKNVFSVFLMTGRKGPDGLC